MLRTEYLKIVDNNKPPLTIEAFLDERIIYLSQFVDENKKQPRIKRLIKSRSSKLMLDSIKRALDDFKYCRDLFDYTKKYPQDITIKNRFKYVCKNIFIRTSISVSDTPELSGFLLNLNKQLEAL